MTLLEALKESQFLSFSDYVSDTEDAAHLHLLPKCTEPLSCSSTSVPETFEAEIKKKKKKFQPLNQIIPVSSGICQESKPTDITNAILVMLPEHTGVGVPASTLNSVKLGWKVSLRLWTCF